MRYVALLLLAVCATAEEKDLSKLLEPIRKEFKVPALGGAILRGGPLYGIGVTGVRRLGSDVRVTKDDLWHLGSCTKAMTATLLGRYVERGDISWDLRMEDAFPWMDDMHRSYRAATIDQLLRHRSGVPSDLSFDRLWVRLWQRKGTRTQQRQLLAQEVLRRKPVHTPGTKYLYANAGYAIAGYALEMRTGKSWEQLMRKELFEPLKMKTAGFGAPGKDLDQPWGHSVRSGKPVPVKPGPNADNPPAIGPAGTVHASLRDWSKFVALHLHGAGDGALELRWRRETLRKIQTARPKENYAYGWLNADRPWGGGRVLTHAGSNTMWYCVVWIARNRDFAVLVTCNQGGDDAAKACDRAAGALIRHMNSR